MPETSDRATKSATDSIPEGDLECFECGWGVVPDLCRITMGSYQEILCINPWACWERQCGVPL